MVDILIIPFIVALVTTILILFSPCILKSIYKNKKFFGYGLGFCCSFVTNIVNFLIVSLSFVIIGLYDEDYLDNINNQNNYIFNFEDMFSLSIKAKVFFSVIYTLLNINSFFMTFKFTKTLANQHYMFNVIFTFISGNLLLYVFSFLALIFLSFNPDKINIDMPKSFKTDKDYLLLAIEIIVIVQMYGNMGTAIMLFLHQKRTNNAIIWLCFICFFFPNISFIVGLFIKSNEFLILPLLIFNLASLLLGTIFYCKFADSSKEGPIDIDLFLQPNSPIERPPY